jgi:tRNA-binding protein
MKATFYYNFYLIGDVLLVSTDSINLPTSSKTIDDTTIIYSNDKVVGINIFNWSQYGKIKSEGRIILPPRQMIDIVNVKIAPFGIEPIDYVEETGFKVGEIIDVDIHPSSDHLHILKVDIGKEVLQIVCGASNVKVGMRIVVATVGTHMMNDVEIKDGMLLGVMSQGMCCSPRELGIEGNFLPHHLLEVDSSVPLGSDFFSLTSN